MGIYLNGIAPSEEYGRIAKTRFFVDKSEMIGELISVAELDGQRYFCITRPRRFGKSIMANMLAAFFGKAAEGSGIFDGLKISGYDCFRKYLNKYDVIYIDFSRLPENCASYDAYIQRILNGIKQDLIREYPELNEYVGTFPAPWGARKL